MGYSTTDTFASLIDEVTTSLSGFGTENDSVCTLLSAVTATAVSLSVDDADDISRGLIEIDEEIMYVSSALNGTVQLQPWGRGYKGTTAAAHAANSPLYISPTWPRAIVAREINNTIRAVYPNIWGIGTLELAASPTSWQYEVTAAIERVLSVEWRWATDLDGWMPISGWELIHSANVSDFGTGRALAIAEPLPAGCRLHITYARIPSFLSAPTDTYASTGLPASSRDVIVYGAASRLLPWQDTGRVPVSSVSSDVQDSLKPVGNSTALSKELRNLYVTRLSDERRALLERYPARTHRTR